MIYESMRHSKLNFYYILDKSNTIIYVFQEFTDREALEVFSGFDTVAQAALVKLVAYSPE